MFHDADTTTSYEADASDAPAGFAKEQLRSFVDRIMRLEDEKKAISDDIKNVFAEAKANGFDGKALREILKIMRQDADERQEHDAIVEPTKPSVRKSLRFSPPSMVRMLLGMRPVSGMA